MMRVQFDWKLRIGVLGAILGIVAQPVVAYGADNALTDVQREMIAQRPLVEAAKVLRQAVEQGSSPGYAGIVIEANGVALWWKGAVPARVTAAVERAQKLASVRVAEATHSRAELRAAAAQLRAKLGANAPIHTIKEPGDGSRLILSAAPEVLGRQTQSAFAKSIPDVGVQTELAFEDQLQPVSRNDDAPPWKGGAVIRNASNGAGCTSGFGVIAAGRPAVLTAGHCASQNGQGFNDGSGQFIGNATQKSGQDQVIIPTTSTSNLIYVGNRQSNTTKRVTAWEACFIGELLCQSGVTTAQAIGSELCRIRVNSFNTDSESLVEGSQQDGQTGARPGDSGGPLYSDLGSTVIAKGTMTRTAGARVGFQDMPTANQAFGGIQIPGGANPTPTPVPGGVVVFQHCNFTGWRAPINATGNVSLGQIQTAGGVNDDASSIQIPAGTRVTLFENINQQGRSLVLTANTACLVGANFNDILSSMRIERIQ